MFALDKLNRMIHRTVLAAIVFLSASVAVRAQFKEVPPPPYTPTVARQKIRALLQNDDPANRQQIAATLSGLVVWYRDILDDELIAAWRGAGRTNLPALMPLFADSRVASAIVEFSWHQARALTFNLTYAPMLADLMARYPGSADPFVRDLTRPAAAGGQMPDLSATEADTVCRILLDMPDTGDWKKIALQVLPHYRTSAQTLLVQDLHGTNKEKSYRAQFWVSELRFNVPDTASDRQDQRRKLIPRTAAAASPSLPGNQVPSDTFAGRPHIVDQPAASLRPGDAQAYSVSTVPFSLPYTGPLSGTLKCSGTPIPPNAEYIFPGMPPGNLQIDLDGKPWDARLAPGRGQTQDLILTNRSSSPQKRCTVRWKIIP
jgi:hypothetical protein